jgi:hypothetical protein
LVLDGFDKILPMVHPDGIVVDAGSFQSRQDQVRVYGIVLQQKES